MCVGEVHALKAGGLETGTAEWKSSHLQVRTWYLAGGEARGI